MLCLHDSIRDNDPAVQRLLSAVEDAHSLPEFILAAWQVARVLTVHLVEAVLAARARHPTLWPRCPQCGVCLRSKGFAKRQITSLFGPLQWRRPGPRPPPRATDGRGGGLAVGPGGRWRDGAIATRCRRAAGQDPMARGQRRRTGPFGAASHADRPERAAAAAPSAGGGLGEPR